tara:strand:- start:424 stop:753 length:330 start_codon:yes stop_codon:yes gene_type:complete
MLVLETRNGDFILSNATRIDFYRREEKNVWIVSMSIDSFRFSIQSFDNTNDSFIFCQALRHQVLSCLEESENESFDIYSLDSMCIKALDIVINGEDDSEIVSKTEMEDI